MVALATSNRFKPILTREQYAEAEERYLRGEKSKDIADFFQCKVTTLDSHFSRKGLPAKREDRLKGTRGERTKEKIALAAENMVDQVLKKQPTGLESMNLHADTLQKVTKTAAIVHGWGDSTNIAIIVAGDISGDPEPEAIEVESEVEVATERQQVGQE